jgi:hypothetical protein
LYFCTSKASELSSKLEKDVYTAVFGLESTAKQIFIKDKLAAGAELPAGWEIDVKNCFKKFAAETMRVQAKESNSRVDGTPS